MTKPDKITIEPGKYATVVRLHYGAESDLWRKGPYKRERAFASAETATEHARRAFPGVPVGLKANRRRLRRNYDDLHREWDRVNYEQRQAEKSGDYKAIERAKAETRRVYNELRMRQLTRNDSRNREGLSFEQWAREAGIEGRSVPGAHAAWIKGKNPVSWSRAAYGATMVANGDAMSVYYSVRIPWSATPTAWHPTSRTGPMSVLTRGAFKTKGEAHAWAASHLRGEPYDVAAFEHALEANGRRRRSRRNGDADVGNIIAQQLGGVGRLRVMLNAKNIYAIENGLQFGFAGRRETGNKVVIKLEPSDTYRVEFWWVRGAKAVLVKAFDDIYAEQLMDIFEKQTGLYLTMHPRRNSRRRRSKKRTSRRSR